MPHNITLDCVYETKFFPRSKVEYSIAILVSKKNTVLVEIGLTDKTNNKYSWVIITANEMLDLYKKSHHFIQSLERKEKERFMLNWFTRQGERSVTFNFDDVEFNFNVRYKQKLTTLKGSANDWIDIIDKIYFDNIVTKIKNSVAIYGRKSR